MIYGRFGDEAMPVRLATIGDIRGTQGKAIASNANTEDWIVVAMHGQERVYRRSDLRADGGIREIIAAIAGLK